MNLFNPPKYAKGKLTDVSGNAFSIMGYFRGQAIAFGWSKDDVEKVIKEAKSSDYDNLVATINSHLTTKPSKLFASGTTQNDILT